MRGVLCNNCGERVVPRLWTYREWPLGSGGYPRTQHICSYCGACMYESGGGLNPLGKFCVFVIAGVPIFLFLILPIIAVVEPKIRKSQEFLRSLRSDSAVQGPASASDRGSQNKALAGKKEGPAGSLSPPPAQAVSGK